MFVRHRHVRVFGNRASRRWTAVAAGSLLVASGLGVSMTTPGVAHADSRSAPTANAAGPGAATTAMAEAKRTGHPVQIPSLTTENETVTANPSGTLTLTQSIYPARVRRSGTWVPIDTTLHVAQDGTLQPAAVPSQIALSDGGSAPLATMTSTGRKLSLRWPDALPQPAISGSMATYADVMPGVDLKVTVSPLGGFSEVLVVKNATAAADPRLGSLALTTESPGLTMTSQPDGGVLVTDRSGVGVFTAPTALMWDSGSQAADGATTVHPSAVGPSAQATGGLSTAARASATPASSAAGPGHGARLGAVHATASRGRLTLTPDTGLLRGTSTHYPVYIDPDFQPVPASDPITGYDEVQQGCPGKNAYKSTTAPYDTPGVGLNDYSGCIGIERALYQFKVDPRLWNQHVAVIDATFKAKEVYSASCSVTSNVSLSLISSVGTGTTWTTQPGSGAVQDTKSFGSACTSNPSQGFDVMDAFTKAHNQGWQGVAFVMKATDESNDLDFRRFSNNPTITVEYNTIPSVVSATTSPDASRIGQTSVSLNAYVSDADKGAPVQAKFTIVGKNSAGTVVYPKKSLEPAAQVTQAGDITWRVGVLPTGTYTWTAQADDGDAQHPALVTAKTFTVDATAPKPPEITSPQVIPDPSQPDVRIVPPARTQLEFDITHPSGSTDIAYYAYNWGSPPPTVNPPLRINPNPGTLDATLYATPVGFARDQLYVYAVDTAGNESSAATFAFTTQPPTGADATGDLTGDGRPDLVLPGSDGNLRLYPGSGSGRVTTPVNLWASGGGAADFTDARIAVGSFMGQAEQDVLIVRAGGADIYEGNGDGEPLPWTSMTHDDTASGMTQAATLESPIDENTGAPIAGLQWPDVSQVAADDSQHAANERPNLWLVSKDGRLYWAERSTVGGFFNAPVLINTGFQNSAIASAGVVGGHPALWVHNTATGTLTLYTGTDTAPAGSQSGAPGTPVTSPAGWAAGTVSSIFSAGDGNVTSGVPGLWATDGQAVHNIYYYPPSTTASSLPSRTRVQTVNPNDDFTGDGQADIVAEWGDGTLHLYTGEGGGKITGGHQIWDASWSSIRAMVSGDFTGDGRSDVIAIWGDGTLHRYDGTGTGGLGNGVTLYNGSQSWTMVRELAAGDFTGDGSTDLVAVWNDGSLHLYVNNGQGTFGSPTSFWADNTWSGMRLLSGGDYNGDGNSDLLAVKTTNGDLYLYLGDGAGHLASSVQSGSLDWSKVKDIIPGDFSGDGKVDLAAIWSDGTLHLYSGSGTGTFTLTGSMWDDASWSTVKLAT